MKNQLNLKFITMKYYLVAALFFFSIGSLFSQCELRTETGTYEALCFNSLVDESGYTMMTPKISIAKNGKSGYFILKLNSLGFGNLSGNVILYLDDNSRITLINRNLQWKVNDELFCQFILTANEISKLKEINIRAVRYWPYYTDGAKEYYNKEHYSMFSTPNKDGIPTQERYERTNLPELITKLYEN
ncbi:MAG: hypothetical protein JW866_08995 [Ignavibacteriales bacterium]|nr:hypothetical protein [Ignavibacteriales bacterium]